MSLLDEFMVPCIIMDKVRTSDGEGGYTVTWTESAEIKAAIVLNNSTLQQIAQKQGATGNYTITTSKSVVLDFHDIIKRVSDGKYFRIISDKNEKTSPASSSLDISNVTAEEWEMTS